MEVSKHSHLNRDPQVTTDRWNRLAEKVRMRTGLAFGTEKIRDLKYAVRRCAAETDIGGADSFLRGVLAESGSGALFQRLLTQLTIGETYFFRDKSLFDFLRDRILPAILKSNHSKYADQPRKNAGMQIWSAGCSSGEEPYSIAMLLDQTHMARLNGETSLWATDINPQFLEKALNGRYSRWSFRDAPPAFQTRYFEQIAPNAWELQQNLRSRVTYSLLNLAQETYPAPFNHPGRMDLVLCRNVLMYFDDETTQKVIARLHHALKMQGWLVVAPAEAGLVRHSGFESVPFKGGNLFRKIDRNGKTESRVTADIRFKPINPEVAGRVGTDGMSGQRRNPPTGAGEAVVFSAPPQRKTGSATRPGSIQSNSTQEDFTVAQRLYRQHRYAEAVEKLAGILEAPGRITPTRRSDWEQQGAGITDTDETKAQTESTSAMMLLMAKALANLGRLSDALTWANRTASKQPLDPARHYLVATIQEALGDLSAAVSAMKRVIYLEPKNISAYFALANLARKQGRHESARRYFNNTAALLATVAPDSVVENTDGVTVGRLAAIVKEIRRNDAGEATGKDAGENDGPRKDRP